MADDKVAMGLAWLGAFLFSTVCHEAAHAYAGWKLGDDTAWRGGQVSLDPLPHIRREPWGMVVLPIFSLLSSGWVMGWASTPYDPHWAERYPRRSALMSAAGPAANLLLLILCAAAIHLGIYGEVFLQPDSINFSRVVDARSEGAWSAVATLVSILFTENLILLALNLLPLPPLDGSSAFGLLLPEALFVRYNQFMQQPWLPFVGLLVAWQFFGVIFDPVHLFTLNLLYPGSNYY